jgi:hypothetical protein
MKRMPWEPAGAAAVASLAIWGIVSLYPNLAGPLGTLTGGLLVLLIKGLTLGLLLGLGRAAWRAGRRAWVKK